LILTVSLASLSPSNNPDIPILLLEPECWAFSNKNFTSHQRKRHLIQPSCRLLPRAVETALFSMLFSTVVCFCLHFHDCVLWHSEQAHDVLSAGGGRIWRLDRFSSSSIGQFLIYGIDMDGRRKDVFFPVLILSLQLCIYLLGSVWMDGRTSGPGISSNTMSLQFTCAVFFWMRFVMFESHRSAGVRPDRPSPNRT
jgi:hypothetical protein